MDITMSFLHVERSACRTDPSTDGLTPLVVFLRPSARQVGRSSWHPVAGSHPAGARLSDLPLPIGPWGTFATSRATHVHLAGHNNHTGSCRSRVRSASLRYGLLRHAHPPQAGASAGSGPPTLMKDPGDSTSIHACWPRTHCCGSPGASATAPTPRCRVPIETCVSPSP